MPSGSCCVCGDLVSRSGRGPAPKYCGEHQPRPKCPTCEKVFARKGRETSCNSCSSANSCRSCGGEAQGGDRGRTSPYCAPCHPRPRCLGCDRRTANAGGGYCSSCIGVVCPTCETRFFPDGTNRKFCSRECRYRQGTDFRPGPAPCAECGSEFHQGSSAYRFCSARCRRRADKRRNTWVRNNWDDKAKARAKERRARQEGKLGARVERFSPAEIYERDRWTCGICKRPVDHRTEYPDPLSPSIDHVVPLSLGGDHTRENVQCAHLVCNLSKGNDPSRVTIFEEVTHGEARPSRQTHQLEAP